MSNFVASNGVTLDRFGDVYARRLCDSEASIHEARKEFYQRLRDEELGRWRDPEAPSFVVYTTTPDKPNRISVVDENTGHSELYFRYRTDSSDYGDAAARYFAAHPELKPWHDAIPGEIWVIHETGFPDSEGAPYVAGDDGFRLAGFDHLTPIPLTSPKIIKAARIWPEGDSDG